MQKIEARMLAMKTSSSSAAASAPIVQIGVFVFGGSVTIGNGCPVLPEELNPFFQEIKMGEVPPENVRAIDCAWPTRLQVRDVCPPGLLLLDRVSSIKTKSTSHIFVVVSFQNSCCATTFLDTTLCA
jgi:hypothetical protein